MLGSSTWRAATVAALETGRRNVSLTELGRLCHVLGVDLRTLAGDEWNVEVVPPVLEELAWLLDGGRNGLVAGGLDDALLAALLRKRRLQQFEISMIEKVDPRYGTATFNEREQLLSRFSKWVGDRYGRDLLAERDERVERGDGTATWVSRRLIDELSADWPELGKRAANKTRTRK